LREHPILKKLRLVSILSPNTDFLLSVPLGPFGIAHASSWAAGLCDAPSSILFAHSWI